MGVGMPDDLVESVARGDRPVRLRAADPQRAQRAVVHGQGAALHQGRRPRRGRPPRSTRSARATPAPTSRGRNLRHLHVAKEMTGAVLNTVHNLHFYLDTMRRIRGRYPVGRVRAVPASLPPRIPPPAETRNPGSSDAPMSLHDIDALFAMAQPAGQQPGPFHNPVPAADSDPRHLLRDHLVADEAAAEQDPGVPGRAEGR